MNKLWVTLAHPFMLHHLNTREAWTQDLQFITRVHYGLATPLGAGSYQNIFICMASYFKNQIDLPSLSQASCLFVFFFSQDRKLFWNNDVQFSQRIFNFFSCFSSLREGVGEDRILLQALGIKSLMSWFENGSFYYCSQII